VRIDVEHREDVLQGNIPRPACCVELAPHAAEQLAERRIAGEIHPQRPPPPVVVDSQAEVRLRRRAQEVRRRQGDRRLVGSGTFPRGEGGEPLAPARPEQSAHVSGAPRLVGGARSGGGQLERGRDTGQAVAPVVEARRGRRKGRIVIGGHEIRTWEAGRPNAGKPKERRNRSDTRIRGDRGPKCPPAPEAVRRAPGKRVGAGVEDLSDRARWGRARLGSDGRAA